MGIRPAKTIRDTDKVPWTRHSKVKKKNFIKAIPHQDIHTFVMGKRQGDFNVQVDLVAEHEYYHRDNALEAARKSSNGYLEKKIPERYFFRVRPFPHHVIRENKMVAGAGADRIQQGMRNSFGRPVDKAAKVKKGQPIITVYSYKENIPLIREALRRASRKLTGTFKIVVKEGGSFAI